MCIVTARNEQNKTGFASLKTTDRNARIKNVLFFLSFRLLFHSSKIISSSQSNLCNCQVNEFHLLLVHNPTIWKPHLFRHPKRSWINWRIKMQTKFSQRRMKSLIYTMQILTLSFFLRLFFLGYEKKMTRHFIASIKRFSVTRENEKKKNCNQNLHMKTERIFRLFSSKD